MVSVRMRRENEGRIITLEFEKFYIVNVYTPNAKRDLQDSIIA